jgi:hypothetical protein
MKMIKSSRMTWEGNMALDGEKRNAYSVLVRKHKKEVIWKRTLNRSQGRFFLSSSASG